MKVKYLIIQTASIGDVILSTCLAEKLYFYDKECEIDFLVKKGNESLFDGHPFINKIYIWDKNKNKYKNLINLIRQIRKQKYDTVFNLQRFLSSGLITVFSRAKKTIGFDKNPLSFLFSEKQPHIIIKGFHEIDRDLSLSVNLYGEKRFLPKLYPTQKDILKIQNEVLASSNPQKYPYYTLSPSSLWPTKCLPSEKWVSVFDNIAENRVLYLLGSKNDIKICEYIKEKLKNKQCINLSGQLTLLESAVLMKGAVMNFTNDSAPLHLCSAVNAPVTAVFCSTVTDFGFYPLSDNGKVIENTEKLACRPCNLHGKKYCPKKHFICAEGIKKSAIIARL